MVTRHSSGYLEGAMAIDLRRNIFEQLGDHLGHKLECVEYGEGLNRAIECETCQTVLIDEDGDKVAEPEEKQERALAMAMECLLMRADQWREMGSIGALELEEMYESTKEECMKMSKMYRDAYVTLGGD